MNAWSPRTFAILSVLVLPTALRAAPVAGPFSLDANVGVLTSTGDGAFALANPTGAAPVRGCFAPIELAHDGDAIVLGASMSRSVEAGNIQFRIGLFDARDAEGVAGHLGYFVGSSANDNAAVVFRRNGLGAAPYWSGQSGGVYLSGTNVTTPSTMPSGEYALSLTITRVTSTTLRIDYAMVRSGGGYSMIGSFEDRAPQQLADDLAYDCAGFFLNGGGYQGTIALSGIDVRYLPAAGVPLERPRPALVPLRAMTFNIRYAGNEPSNYAWSQRRPRVVRVITDAVPDIVGVQEALPAQVQQLRTDLSEYGFYGVGRDNGQSAGEHAGIFFRSSRFSLEDSGSFWLSDTPSVPGTTFSTLSGATARIASWVVLRDSGTERRYFVLNTHWDNQDQSARDRSASLIRERIATLADGLPVLLLGDFNVTETNAASITLIGTNVTAGNRLIDAFRRVTPNVGAEERTFQGFTTQTSGARIDFILHSPHLRAMSAAIVRDLVSGYLPSDHYPVVASFDVARIATSTGEVDAGMGDGGVTNPDDGGVADPDDGGVTAPHDAHVADAAADEDASFSDGSTSNDGAVADDGAPAPDGASPPATEPGGCSASSSGNPRACGAWLWAAVAAAVAMRRRRREHVKRVGSARRAPRT